MAELEELKPVIEDDNEKIVSLKVRIGENESKALSRNEIIERVRDDVTELEVNLNDYRQTASDLEHDKEVLTSSGEVQSDKEAELRQTKSDLEQKISDLASEQEKNRAPVPIFAAGGERTEDQSTLFRIKFLE